MPLAPRALIKSWRTFRSLRTLPFRVPTSAADATASDCLRPVAAHSRTPNETHRRWLKPGRTGNAAGQSYGTIGSLEVRLARSRLEVRAAQRLRYRVFFEEMTATPSVAARMRRRDEDAYDPLCDHLLVVDHARPATAAGRRWRRRANEGAIVGTYRILRQDVAERHDGFYTQGEFNVEPMLAAKHDLEFMELGRSCVLATHRSKRAVELLWHGLWTYIRENGVDVMIGCASFAGTDPDAHATALSFLHHTAQAPAEWRVRAHESRRVAMDRVPAERIDAKAALKAMPPLIKGYLRLGAYVGDGAVIDHQFGTTDVLIILPVERIDPRYFARFGDPDEVSSRIRPEARGIM